MSTIGSGSGHSPMWPRWVRPMWPPLIRQMSALVPPISTVIRSSIPQAAATARAPTTPAAGPDSAVSAGALRIACAPATPPFDCISSSGALHLRVAQALLEPRHIGRDARHDGGVEHGRERALVFADHRQHVDRRRHRHAGQFLAQDLGDAFLMGRIGEGMQQADRDGLHLQAAAFGRRGAHARLVERAQHHAAGADALVDLEHARRPAPGAPASPRCRDWRGAGCPAGRW